MLVPGNEPSRSHVGFSKCSWRWLRGVIVKRLDPSDSRSCRDRSRQPRRGISRSRPGNRCPCNRCTSDRCPCGGSTRSWSDQTRSIRSHHVLAWRQLSFAGRNCRKRCTRSGHGCRSSNSGGSTHSRGADSGRNTDSIRQRLNGNGRSLLNGNNRRRSCRSKRSLHDSLSIGERLNDGRIRLHAGNGSRVPRRVDGEGSWIDARPAWCRLLQSDHGNGASRTRPLRSGFRWLTRHLSHHSRPRPVGVVRIPVNRDRSRCVGRHGIGSLAGAAANSEQIARASLAGCGCDDQSHGKCRVFFPDHF